MSNETKIVPVEPTLAMDAAGETALGKHLNKAGYYGGHLAAYKAMLEAAPAPDDELALLKHIRTITDCQAEDEGLWFDAVTAPEAYLQQELRKLHSAIEAAPAPDDKDKRIAELDTENKRLKNRGTITSPMDGLFEENERLKAKLDAVEQMLRKALQEQK